MSEAVLYTNGSGRGVKPPAGHQADYNSSSQALDFSTAEVPLLIDHESMLQASHEISNLLFA